MPTVRQRHGRTDIQTDRQTDRQTDGRLTIAIPRFALREDFNLKAISSNEHLGHTLERQHGPDKSVVDAHTNQQIRKCLSMYIH